MKTSSWIAAAAGLLALAMLAGCGTNAVSDAVHAIPDLTADKSLQTHAVKSIKTVRIDRIAVMPIIDAPDVTMTPGGKDLEEGAGEVVTAELYSQCSLAAGWEVAPSMDVRKAMQQLPPTTPLNMDQNAIALGKRLGVDGVLYGAVERYKERVGYDYAAAHPASVAFSLKFVDINLGKVIWSAKFAKSQKALNQNVFALIDFVHNQARWVRAHEIAMQGVKEAVANLHGNFNFAAHVKRFETSTYGQLKSGGQRYNGTGGLY